MPRRFSARAKDRRGVLILVVLSLLIMFVVVAVMYVAVATRARAVSKSFSEVGRTGDAPPHMVDTAFRDLIRGSLNPNSPLRHLSLLEDLYGRSVRGRVAGPPTTAVHIPASTPAGPGSLMQFYAQPSAAISTIEDAYGGCLLTLISGDSKGMTFRILHTSEDPPSSSIVKFTVMPIAGEQVQTTTTAASIFTPAAPEPRPFFVINGHPFSGTGVGFNKDYATGTGVGGMEGPLDAIDPNTYLYALLPNPAFFQPNPVWSYLDPAGLGGANEDYDAPDYQNPHLAFFASANPTGAVDIKPSFHDPALLEYWYEQPGNNDLFTNAGKANLLRKIMFRPNGHDHPVFAANVNPQLWALLLDGNPITPPPDPPAYFPNSWDIDNDGDGIADSVWMDLGYPVQTTKDGRRYKTLAAFLVVDLDGRLNINAHGSILPLDAAIGPDTGFDSAIELDQINIPAQPVPVRFAGEADETVSIPLVRGSGYGPADIRLDRLFRPGYVGEYRNLLNGSGGVPGRYGIDYVHRWNGAALGPPTTNRAPGYTGDDAASRIREWDLPYHHFASPAYSFGSPPDLRGRVATGIDVTGQPLSHAYRAIPHATDTNFYNSDWDYEKFDDPYELNLNDVTGRQGWTTAPQPPLPAFAGTAFVPDNPFSPQEIERLLRPFDVDSASLPSRIVQLAPSILQQGWRNLITTHSFDLPVLSPQAPPGSRGMLAQPGVDGKSHSIIELMNAKVSVTVGGGVTAAMVNNAIRTLLAPELRRGLKMNINRAFGNGFDDDGDYLVDEDEESLIADTTPFGANNVPLDASYGVDIDGDSDYDGADGRLLLARHLYVLMMLLAEADYVFLPFEAELNTPAPLSDQQKLYRAQRLAQWAVNVVDFRDNDNIMTRFAYDTKPFDSNGWQTTGADVRVVYGCEMPVLLLTETLAFHSRRVVDSAHDDGDAKARDEMPGDMMAGMDDNDLDQAMIPRGAAFFELLALFNPNLPHQAGDLFIDSGGGNWKLHLQKSVAGSPVWRLAITDFHTTASDRVTFIKDEHLDTVSLDPRYVNFNLLENDAPDVHNVTMDRYVYFSNSAPSQDPNRSYHATGVIVAPANGEYVVVGPGGVGGGARTSGALTGIPVGGVEPYDPSTQRLNLRVGARFTTAATQFADPDNTTTVRDAYAIPVASSAAINTTFTVGGLAASWAAGDRVGVSISEPLFSMNYYPKPAELNASTGLTEAYGDLTEGDPAKKFPDEPLDTRQGMGIIMPLNETQRPADFSGDSNTDNNMLATGTYSNVRTVFLQRLADPTRGYDFNTNPYITVDWMPIDLTVFNGEDHHDPMDTDFLEDEWDPDDPDANADHATGVNFISRQRGRVTTRATTKSEFNIWSPVFEGPLDTDPAWKSNPAALPVTHHFRHQLFHSLGYLNQSYGEPMTTVELQSGGAMDPVRQHRGWPKAHNSTDGKTIPWIKWNNRPYTGVHELLQVPASAPSRLCFEFSYADPQGASPTTNSYSVTGQATREFRHLLNFFHSRQDQSIASPESGDLFCVLDFLHVPSRFSGTETVLNPDVYSEVVADTQLFRPPFNLISNYRDPGRVNLNTINDQRVYEAVAPRKDDGTLAVSWIEFNESRRGDSDPSLLASVGTASNVLPTIMGNPFRSGASADLVPQPVATTPLKHDGVNATLLRAKGIDPDATAAEKTPLFGSATSDAAASTDPLYRNNSRNAALRYQNIERLSNTVTTRSNVYAIWVTTGFFEVEANPAGIDAGHPDGYRIGIELGSDTGDVKRHRGFYIFDRSIPVGFERGMNHNVDRGIILNRFIE